MGLVASTGTGGGACGPGVGAADAETSKQGGKRAAPAKGSGDAKDAGGESPLDIKADVGAVLQQVLDLVLGGIADDEARKAVNAEYLKLKAAFDKADKLGTTPARVTAYQAVHAPGAGSAREGRGHPLRARPLGRQRQAARRLRRAPPSARSAARRRRCWRRPSPVSRPTRCARRAPATARAAVRDPAEAGAPARDRDAAAEALEGDRRRHRRGGQGAPRARQEARLRPAGAPRHAAGREEERLAGGTTFEEVAAQVDGLLAEAGALQTEGRELTTNLADEKELEAVRKRLDGLKPRIDRADDAGMPKPIEDRQENVRNFAKVIEEQMAAKNKAAVLKTLANLTLQLGDLEQMKERYLAYRRKFEAARDGPVKRARALN
jgi:hypothetical protein